MKSSVVSLSGGMDSATVLTKAVGEQGVANVLAVSFAYPSKHNKIELRCAQKIATHYNVKHKVIDITTVMEGFSSNLLKGQGAIPEGHYEAQTMSQTVVPARNIIFGSILAGMAWSIGADSAWLGIHQGDHAIYPDCRADFFQSFKQTIELGSDNLVSLVAPFLETNKEGILRYGLAYGTPYQLTRTCYQEQEVACGRCGSCQERLASFLAVGEDDPLPYVSRVLLPKE